MGERGAASRVIVGRKGSVQGWGAQDTVLIARNAFSSADIDRALTCLRASGMEAVYYPGSAAPNPFRELLLSANPEDYQRAYRFDIAPVTDNRPFFFYTVQPRDLLAFVRSAPTTAADYNAVNRAVPLLFGLMGISLVATLLILILPPLVLRTRLPSRPGVRGFLLYFLFIGAGYILIEVALIQKFVLFLGQPVYALTVVIFSMLASSGLGSAFSRQLIGPREGGAREGGLIKVLGCVALLAALLALVATQAMTALLWLPIQLKIALTVAMIAPLGFAMGMPFPSALRRLEEWHAPSVRWAWSLNAASSVLGSVGGADVRDLSRPGANADHRRPVLPRGDGGAGESHVPRDAGSRAGPGPGDVGELKGGGGYSGQIGTINRRNHDPEIPAYREEDLGGFAFLQRRRYPLSEGVRPPLWYALPRRDSGGLA